MKVSDPICFFPSKVLRQLHSSFLRFMTLNFSEEIKMKGNCCLTFHMGFFWFIFIMFVFTVRSHLTVMN